MDYSQQPQAVPQQQQQQQQGIPMVPQQPTPVYEKAPEYPPQQPAPMPMHQGHQFMTAMPLAALTRSPAPVDCPSCGARALTACSYQSGDNAQ
jgi:hypothetical protein